MKIFLHLFCHRNKVCKQFYRNAYPKLSAYANEIDCGLQKPIPYDEG